jgi:hypothetical protein
MVLCLIWRARAAQIDEFLKTGTLRELEEGGGFQQPGAPPPEPTGDAAMALKFL